MLLHDLAEQLQPTLTKKQLQEAKDWAEAYQEDEGKESTLEDPYTRLVALDMAMAGGDYIWDDIGDEALMGIIEVVGKKLKAAQPPPPKAKGGKPAIGNYSEGEMVRVGRTWYEIEEIYDDGELSLLNRDTWAEKEVAPKDFGKILERKAKPAPIKHARPTGTYAIGDKFMLGSEAVTVEGLSSSGQLLLIEDSTGDRMRFFSGDHDLTIKGNKRKSG